jgi:hypothetical protein
MGLVAIQDAVQVRGGADQGEVGERLWKVAQSLSAEAGLLRIQA